VAGRGLFNKLVDTFNAVADDARRQIAPKSDQATAVTSPATDAGRAAAQMESARQMASDSGRQALVDDGRAVTSDSGRAVVADGGRAVVTDSAVACRFCKTPNPAGAACLSCGATPDR
jgi:hypothetical protein